MLQATIKQATATPRRTLLSVLALTSLAGLAMLAFRISYGGTIGYWSLPWDLILAWLPVPFALAVARRAELERKPWATILFLGFLWLLFFPNAPYLLTQFMHLHPSYGVYDGPHRFAHLTPEGNIPLWYDVMMLCVFAWTGLLLGFLSLHLIHGAASRVAGPACGWAVVFVGTALCAFGVSLGRFERWNSWDLFAQPLTLMSDVLDRAFNPLAHPRTSGVTIVLASFLLLSYLTLIALMHLKSAEESDARAGASQITV
jgi:uncharacterized membrane protein